MLPLTELEFDLPLNKMGADGGAAWHWLHAGSETPSPAAKWPERPPLAKFTSRVHLVHHPERAILSLTASLTKSPMWISFVNEHSQCSSKRGVSLAACVWIEWNRLAMQLPNVKMYVQLMVLSASRSVLPRL
jgi:hypothetical protein